MSVGLQARAHVGPRVAILARPSRARRFFDRLAPFYDAINHRLYRPAWLAVVREHIRGPRVLDVGVGTGYTTGHLDGAVGIDLSPEMLRRASYQGHLILADFLHPPVREGSFDTVLFAGSFYYLPDPEESLRTAARLLRPHGAVVILAPATRALAPFVHVLGRDDYAGLMAAAGLRMETFLRLGRPACLAVGRKL